MLLYARRKFKKGRNRNVKRALSSVAAVLSLLTIFAMMLYAQMPQTVDYQVFMADTTEGSNGDSQELISSESTALPTDAQEVPPGGVIMWSGTVSSIPVGWLLCDGANGTPDLTDRFILGVAAGEDPGETGGSHSITLSTPQLARHLHGFTTYSAGNHSHDYITSEIGNHSHTYSATVLHYLNLIGWGDKNGSPKFASSGNATTTNGNHVHTGTTGSTGSHSHTGSTDAIGENQPVDNRPAYYKLAFIMKDWGEIPTGGIIMWSGKLNSIPAGWQLCDGTNGSPDLIDRFILGTSIGEDPGEIGGSHTFTLAISQLPGHSHDITTIQSGNHSHSFTTLPAGTHSHPVSALKQGSAFGDGDGSPRFAKRLTPFSIPESGNHSHTGNTVSAGNHSHTGTTNNVGQNEPIDNRPAFFKLAFIMKKWGNLPPGGIIIWPDTLNSIPTGWRLCDGTFGNPDLTNRFILGAATQQNPGETGGSHSYSLTTSQLPEHSHPLNTAPAGSHSHFFTTSSTGVHSHLIDNALAEGGTWGDADGGPFFAKAGKLTIETAGKHSHSGTTEFAGSHSHTGFTNNAGENQLIDNRPAYYTLAFIASQKRNWQQAYTDLLESKSDLELLRRYRDEILTSTKKGRQYKELLYENSEQILKVLLDNPKLLRKAHKLIQANKHEIAAVLNGDKGVIQNTDKIVKYLKAFAKKSPPALKFWVKVIRWQMIIDKKRGRPFLGFRLE